MGPRGSGGLASAAPWLARAMALQHTHSTDAQASKWNTSRAAPVYNASWVAGAVLGACGVANRWLKVSLRAAVALYAAALWDAWSVTTALVALPLAASVGWSRVQLGRHSWREVGCGMAIGLVGGVLLLVSELGSRRPTGLPEPRACMGPQ